MTTIYKCTRCYKHQNDADEIKHWTCNNCEATYTVSDRRKWETEGKITPGEGITEWASTFKNGWIVASKAIKSNKGTPAWQTDVSYKGEWAVIHMSKSVDDAMFWHNYECKKLDV